MSFLSRSYRLPPPTLVARYFQSGEELVDAWSPEKLRAYQREALFHMVVHAWDNSPFYRQKFLAAGVQPTTLDLPGDLGRLPFTSKDELRGKPWVLLSVPRHQISQINVSTGTTSGDEIYVPQSWDDIHVRAMAPAMRKLIPVDSTDVVVNALPYEMSSSGLAFHRTFQKSYGALVFPAGKGGFYSTPERTIQAARDLQATVLVTTPSFAVMMAEAARQLDLDLAQIPLRFLWLTGEGCSGALRERIEKTWGHPALFYYGSLEAGPIGIECEARSGYHLTSGHVYVEVVDARTGAPLPAGETGEVVITELTRHAAPLIRYRTEDLGVLDLAPCACGITLPRVQLRGRAVDQVRVGGKSFGPYFLEHLLLQSAEVGDWYQLFPRGDRLLVKMEAAPGVTPSEATARTIAERLQRSTGVPVQAEFVASIPRHGGKNVRVVREP
jgi:phenylacetate-CoA ligase